MATPRNIGRYEIREQLGAGGFATVWHGYDAKLDNDVAVKILAENWVQRLDVQERFLEEARALRRADSDRVVRVYDIDALDDGRPYFVMSYGDLGTLNDRLADGPLPIDLALWYAQEIARGTGVLHDLGILHRDLKPSNILLATAGTGRSAERVMVADLGLAKALAHSSGFTVAAGTPGYMAPEQASVGGNLDKRADVYALGAIAYQMLTGRRAVRENPNEPLPAPSQVRSDVPPFADMLVMRALERDREARWPDAQAFADVVGHVVEERRRANAPVTPPAYSPPTQTEPLTPQQHSQGITPQYTPALPPWSQQTGGGQTGGGQTAAPPGVTAYPGGQTPAPAPGGRKRKTIMALVGAGVVVVLLLAGGLYLWQGPQTIESANGVIKVKVPKDWAEGEPRSQVLDDLDNSYSEGTALELWSGRTKYTELGVTIAASRDLANFDPDDSFTYGTPEDFPGYDCGDYALENQYQKTERFDRGTVWKYTDKCKPTKDNKYYYAQAVLVAENKGEKKNIDYGVDVFMTASDPDQFNDVLDSVEVDPDQLPK